ncbi:WD40-repeat-containing domain protein [Nemania sp. NC0429]|nr:WD40-repeat-containing domain protein [Nemania sp. NC0429]
MTPNAAPPGGLGRREYVLNPITALAFLTLGGKRYLLAAEDTDIRVYDVAASRLCGVLPVFRAQSIHGISIPHATLDGSGSSSSSSPSSSRGPSPILVWGGHAVKVLPGRIIEELISSSLEQSDSSVRWDDHETHVIARKTLSAPQALARDWIFDGRVSPFDEDHIVLLTAHNEVVQGRVSEDQSTLVLGRVQSPSRPILYSGNLLWAERDHVLVAAGTVFGEIVVWKCHLGSDDVDASSYASGSGADHAQERQETAGCEVLFVFAGHEGSIFGVHISDEILMGSGDTIRLLASCSDDRTIRIWDITERSDKATTGESGYEAEISGVRQTGYGDSIVGSVGLVNSHSRCVAMAMGHISRIWDVEIRNRRSASRGNMVEVYSFGEDATMQRWHLELGADLEAVSGAPDLGASGRASSKLTHHETFSSHSGKQIWSHAMISYESGLLMATGGGDGKIALIDNDSVHTPRNLGNAADDGVSYHPRAFQELDISPMYLIQECQHQSPKHTSSILSFKHGNGKEMFQSFTFVKDDKLLITTRSGRLFLGSFDAKTGWKELIIPDAVRTIIQSYTILRSSRRSSTAFIGAPNGELFYYHEASGDSLRPIHKAARKITEIICLSDNSIPPSHAFFGSGRGSDRYIELLVTVYGSMQAEILSLDQNHNLVRRTEVTIPDEFIVTTAAWCHSYLLLGSRNGSIAVFKPTINDGYSLLSTVEVSIGDKITSILPLPRRAETSPLYFLTTSRDGKYRIFEILDDTTDTFQARLLDETRPPFGPLIEGSWLFDKPDGKQDLVLYGFRSKYFVVWNATQQREIAAIDCGGGHRVFDQIQMAGNPEGLRFVCTKASQMKIFSQTRAPHLHLKPGGHGREIKAVSASGKYVATGAEDTMIRIWELRGENPGRGEAQPLRCMLALEKHNTGIQRLKWFEDQYLFSSGGNEEFFAWRITPLESEVCALGVVCEAVFPDRSEVGDLRITDFDVRCVDEDATPDDGVQGIDVKPQSQSLRTRPTFCISMALSNSVVQSYLYSARQGFRLLGRRTYTGACLTQLRHLNFTDGYHPQVLVAATDGRLAVFTDIRSRGDENTDLIDVPVTKLHQSTVKSLDMQSIASDDGGTSYLVVTGGDDDAIGVLHIHSPFSPIPPTPPTEPTSRVSISRPDPPPSSDQSPFSASSPDPAHTRHASTRGQGQPQARYYEIRGKFVVRSAHAAAVTGLGILRLENGGRDAVVVTASNDQRVKTWRLVGWRSAEPRVHLLDDRYSGVADAGDLEVVGERVLVAGVGIEVWGAAS